MQRFHSTGPVALMHPRCTSITRWAVDFMKNFLSIIIVFLGLAAARAGEAIKDVNDAIGAAEKVCLVGDRYRFEANADGGITISKFLPSGTGKVVIDRTQARGAQFFNDEAVRRLVDDDIRKCMSGEWRRVLNVLQKKSQNDGAKLTRLTGTWCLTGDPSRRAAYFVVSDGDNQVRLTRSLSGFPITSLSFSDPELTSDWELVDGALFGPPERSGSDPLRPVLHILHVDGDRLMDEVADLSVMPAILQTMAAYRDTYKNSNKPFTMYQKIMLVVDEMSDARREAMDRYRSNGLMCFTYNFVRCS
jgi:hypothetical protein